MKKFIYEIIVIMVAVSMSFYAFCFILDVMGWSDWAYKKFTAKGCTSMIVGTSRAAQGIHPSIVNLELKESVYSLPVYNFSFTMTSSPYGETYYKAIYKKLKKDVKNGFFIITVDPWSLSLTKGDNDAGQYREIQDRLGTIMFYQKPNVQYLYKFGKPFVAGFDSQMILHDDGWLEVNVPMDSISVYARIERKQNEYKEEYANKSDYRIEWLKKTIDFLKEHGTAVMCRIPMDPYFYNLEKKNWPTFEEDMRTIANEKNINYISFENRIYDFRTTDGQHLYKEDGKRFTKDLCDSIKVRLKIK